MKTLRATAFALVLAAAAPARAQDLGGIADTAVEPPHSIVVTSIEKCYAELGHEEALDIQKNFIHPYEECQRRLAVKVRKEHTLKPGDAPKKTGDAKSGDEAKEGDTAKENDAAPAEPSGGYYRVQKTYLKKLPPPEKPAPAPPKDADTPAPRNPFAPPGPGNR